MQRASVTNYGCKLLSGGVMSGGVFGGSIGVACAIAEWLGVCKFYASLSNCSNSRSEWTTGAPLSASRSAV